MIFDSCVKIPSTPFGVTFVTFKKRPHKKYWVHNLELEWASYEDSWAQRGNICKHQEGTISCYYGALKGTIEGGLENLFNPTHVGCSHGDIQYTPLTSRLLK
jgi:hypothetical protein